MLNYLKYAVALLVISSIIGTVTYVIKLQRENLTLEFNNEKLVKAVNEQKELIAKKSLEIAEIQLINSELTDERAMLQADVERLNTIFRISAKGKSRDFGDITRAKPGLVNRIVNRATKNVNRCFEIAMGAEVKEGEKNNECKNLVSSRK